MKKLIMILAVMSMLMGACSQPMNAPESNDSNVNETKAATVLTLQLPSKNTLLADVVKSVEIQDNGKIVIVGVDVDKLKNYVLQSNDPYWVQYLRQFWVSGVHVSNKLPYYAKIPESNCCGSDWYNNGYETVGFNTSNTSTYYTQSQSYFQNSSYSKWYDSRIPVYTYYKNTSTVMRKFFHHHTRGKIGSYYPGRGYTTGTKYFIPYNSSANIYAYNEIHTKEKILLANLYSNEVKKVYPEDGKLEYWRKVIVGEVTADGWGIIPIAPEVKKFIYIKPYTKDLQLASGGVNNSLSTPELFNPNVTVNMNNTDEAFDKAKKELAFGGLVTSGFLTGDGPDAAKEGTLWKVDPVTKQATQIDLNTAITLAKSYDWVNVNGSANTLQDGLNNAFVLAQAKNKPLIHVYMAQGINYAATNDTTFKNVFTSLINSAASGNKLTVTSHSWSGHLVQRIVKNNYNVTHIAINPAHGNLKTGEKIVDYINDIKYSKATVKILAGTADPVTVLGGGAAYYSSFCSTCTSKPVGNTDLRNAINANTKVVITTIKDSGHPVKEMLDKGAATHITFQ